MTEKTQAACISIKRSERDRERERERERQTGRAGRQTNTQEVTNVIKETKEKT